MVVVFSGQRGCQRKRCKGWGKHGEQGVAIAERNKKMLVRQMLRDLGAYILTV